MSISRGELVKKVVQESGYSITRLASRINISRAQLYLDFNNPEMSWDRILAIGKVLKHDFSVEFRDLPSGLTTLLNEGDFSYKREFDDCQSRLLALQTRLIDALDIIARYKEKYGPAPA